MPSASPSRPTAATTCACSSRSTASPAGTNSSAATRPRAACTRARCRSPRTRAGRGTPQSVAALRGLARTYYLEFIYGPEETEQPPDPFATNSAMPQIGPDENRLNPDGERALRFALDALAKAEPPDQRARGETLVELGDWYLIGGARPRRTTPIAQGWNELGAAGNDAVAMLPRRAASPTARRRASIARARPNDPGNYEERFVEARFKVLAGRQGGRRRDRRQQRADGDREGDAVRRAQGALRAAHRERRARGDRGRDAARASAGEGAAGAGGAGASLSGASRPATTLASRHRAARRRRGAASGRAGWLGRGGRHARFGRRRAGHTSGSVAGGGVGRVGRPAAPRSRTSTVSMASGSPAAAPGWWQRRPAADRYASSFASAARGTASGTSRRRRASPRGSHRRAARAAHAPARRCHSRLACSIDRLTGRRAQQDPVADRHGDVVAAGLARGREGILLDARLENALQSPGAARRVEVLRTRSADRNRRP